MTKIGKSRLAIVLSKLKGFTEPKVRVEQYSTDPEIAAEMLYMAYMTGDIEGKVIADLGAGSGILGLGASLLGAKVYLVESEDKAVEMMEKNLEFLKSEFGEVFVPGNVEIIHDDVGGFGKKVDTVVENPPFGTKEKHIDRVFLEKAFKISRVVYSFHKTSTKEFIVSLAIKNGFRLGGVVDYDFSLKHTMKHHRKPKKKIKVSLFRFVKEKTEK